MLYDTIQTCIIYCRVSTKKQAQEGDSLEKQETKCTEEANRRGLQILKVYHEPFTGKKERRPVLDEMLGFLLKNRGKIGHVIFLDIGRASRGGNEGFTGFDKTIRDLGVNLIDVAGIIQPEINYMKEYGAIANYVWAKRRPSRASELMYAEMKNQEVSDMLVRLIGREIQLTQEGYWIGQYPFGFKSEKIKTLEAGTRKRSILVEDPKEAPFIKEMFDQKAKGILSDQEIVDHVNAMGYRSRERLKWDTLGIKYIGRIGGNPLCLKQLNKYLRTPIYAGIIRKKWTHMKPIDAQFSGLVTLDTWNKANRGRFIINRSSSGQLEWYENKDEQRVTKFSVNDDYPFKPVVKCYLCGGNFWASASTGKSGKKFPSYHCSRNHKRIGIPSDKFNEVVENYINSLAFSDVNYRQLKQFINECYEANHREQIKTAKKKGEVVQNLRIELENLYEKLTRTTSVVVEKKLEEQIDKLDKKIKLSEFERNEAELSEHDIAMFLKHVKKILEHPGEFLLKPRDRWVMERLWLCVFEELPTYEELATGTPKLTLFFKLKSTFESASGHIVDDEGYNWNTLENQIRKWNNLFGNLNF